MDILNSEAFRAGVETSIRHTKQTGDETRFVVQYPPGFGVYYDGINIGNKRSVSSHVKFDEVGQELFGEKDRFWNVHQLCRINSEMIRKKIVDNLCFPQVPGLKTYGDYIKWMTETYGEDWTDNPKATASMHLLNDLISFHTHPYFHYPSLNSRIREGTVSHGPSEGDLRKLSMTRQTSKYNPLLVIASLTKNTKVRKFPMIIIQETANSGLSLDSDYKSLSRGFSLYKGHSNSDYGFARQKYDWVRGEYVFGKGFQLESSIVQILSEALR